MQGAGIWIFLSVCMVTWAARDIVDVLIAQGVI